MTSHTSRPVNLKANVLPVLAFVAFVFILLFLNTGCATLNGLIEKYQVPEKAAEAIDQYCVNVPYPNRKETRDKVNAKTTKGDIFVRCDGDPDLIPAPVLDPAK